MSNGDVLYVKGMQMSATEEDEAIEDIWDDRKLNEAYDKALRIANEEVAKRVAMSTNTQRGTKNTGKDHAKTKKGLCKPTCTTNLENKTPQWKTGMPCRAVYEGDGMEYEAVVLRFINDEECVVRFLGYENSELVKVSALKPTLGKVARTRQIEQVMCDKDDDGFASQSPNVDNADCSSDLMASPSSTDRSFGKQRKTPKKKRNHKAMSGFNMSDILTQMPNPAIFGNLNAMDMPLPPPPPIGFSGQDDSEDQTLSSMLLSWYMSGYYTGLYQGMKRAKESSRNIQRE